jgi:hypothetical protein
MILIERLRVLVYEKLTVMKKEIKNIAESKNLNTLTKSGELK